MPTLLASGKYKTNLRYPERFRELTGIKSEKFQKIFATKQLATKAEKDMKKKIAQVIREENANVLEIKGNMKFKDFYQKKWIARYELGQTGRTRTLPSEMTIQNTKDLFRLHILPMFGNYTMNYLNANTEIISDGLTEKSRTYANIRTLKSYVNSMFDVAEILGYIEFNRTTKVIQSITSPRKIALQEKKEQEGKQALTVNELIEWLEVVQNCLNNQSLSFKDYTLFMLTLYLGDRKSESYALQWRHIDLDNHTIRLKFALNKRKKMKKTKGGKDTIIHIPEILVSLLQKWKELQKIELEKFRIEQTPDQHLFTYMKPYGDVNSPLHSDYLNYRINKIMKYNKHLAHLTPHKLRHTYATLAKQGGADLSKISEALTHSEITTTRIYVNTPDVVNLDVYNAFDRVLKQGATQ
ncbi:tyrosine-type recombinase/integrase [Enterococcus olivae]